MAGPAQGIFLTDGERREIQSNYILIKGHMKLDDLIPKLYGEGIISKTDKTNLDSMVNDDKKAQYIIDNVLMKSTYQDLLKVKRLLRLCKIDSHTELAKLLPSRPGDDQNLDQEMTNTNRSRSGSDGAIVNQQHMTPQNRKISSPIPITTSTVTNPVDENRSRRISTSPATFTEKSSAHPSSYSDFTATGEVTGLETSDMFPENVDDSVSSTVELKQSPQQSINFQIVSEQAASIPLLQAAGPMSQFKQCVGKRPREKEQQQTQTDELWDIPEDMRLGLAPYPTKPNSNKVYGNGVCVAIANFTGDLKGYLKDLKIIKDFYRNTLQWKHVFVGSIPTADPEKPQSLINLSRDQMLKVLKYVKELLTNPFSAQDIDRFCLYILSHGDGDGIMTCKDGSAIEREENDEDGKPIRIKIQDIVDMFTHDKVPSLKGFPKLFFIQACQGEKPMQAATLPSNYPPGSSIPIHKKPVWEPPKAPVAVGADTALCEATSKETMSWVGDDYGSMFIQTKMRVFKHLYAKKDFLVMMGVVNNIISSSHKIGEHPRTKERIPAIQMTGQMSTLRQLYYMAIPNYMLKPNDKDDDESDDDNYDKPTFTI